MAISEAALGIKVSNTRGSICLNILGQVEGQDDRHNRYKVEPKARINKPAELVAEIEEFRDEITIFKPVDADVALVLNLFVAVIVYACLFA